MEVEGLLLMGRVHEAFDCAANANSVSGMGEVVRQCKLPPLEKLRAAKAVAEKATAFLTTTAHTQRLQRMTSAN
jgi:hypothetical protein